jgi:hypothetical protein
MLWTVGKYIIVGIVIGAVVERYMPSEWIYRLFGRKDTLNIVWVTLAAVPMFLHQLSASSILSHIKNSLDGTIDGGAALAFMIGGPVTAVPTMVLFLTFFKKRIFALYLFVCIVGTLLIAYTFQFFIFVPGVDLGNPLLKGVGSLSGGVSSVILKKSPNVRMVMDPFGKGIIATYTNDVEGKGALVFDASPSRFSSTFDGFYDNRKYILNVAGWLEQSVNFQGQKRILIYSLSGISPLGVTTLAELAKEGFSVKVVNRSASQRISEPLLADCSQLWLFFDNNSKNGLNDEELKLVSKHNSKSGGTLIVASGSGPEEALEDTANRVSSPYGIRFSSRIENEKKLDVSVASNLLNRSSEMLGKVLKMVRKA